MRKYLRIVWIIVGLGWIAALALLIISLHVAQPFSISALSIAAIAVAFLTIPGTLITLFATILFVGFSKQGREAHKTSPPVAERTIHSGYE